MLTGKVQAILKGHDGKVNSLAFSPDNATPASAGDDKTIRLGRTDTGLAIVALQGHSGRVFGVTISPDGKVIASGGEASDKKTGEARLWSLPAGLKRASLAELTAPG